MWADLGFCLFMLRYQHWNPKVWCRHCWHQRLSLWQHDDVIKWKHFPRYWPFVREITAPGEFPTQRPVTRSFDFFFDLRLNKRLSKQSWGWWFETLSHPLWRHRNGTLVSQVMTNFAAFMKIPGYQWNSVEKIKKQGPLLLTWFNLNPSMEK